MPMLTRRGRRALVEQGPSRKSAVVIAALGFSLYQIWVFTIFFSDFAYQDADGPAGVRTFVRVGSLLSLGGVLMMASFLPNIRGKATSTISGAIAAVGMGFCSVLACAAGLSSPISVASLLGSVVISGVASAVVGMRWARIFRKLSFRELFYALPLVIAICTLLFLVSATSFEATIAMAAIAPIASVALSLKEPAPECSKNNARESTFSMKAKDPVAFATCWACVGATYGLMISMTDKSSDHPSFPWIIVLSGTVSATIAAVVATREPHRDRKSMAPLIVSGCLIVILLATSTIIPPLFPSNNKSAVYETASISCVAVIEAASLMVFSLFSSSTGKTMGFVYSRNAGARSLGTFAGSLVGIIVAQAVPFTSNGITVIALVGFSQLFSVLPLALIHLTEKERIAAEIDQLSRPESSSESPATESDNAEGHWRSPISARCEKLAERYRLTPRETEVMILVAKGRSSERIQSELCIARGTVTAHVHHIYQKMGIHSRQQLLDIVDGS